MLSGPGALNRVGAAVASSLSPASAALNLDFTLGTLDDRITFTRASTATYFDKDGVLQSAASGEARFDYDPSTLAPRGLLIEEQRANLLLQSEDFGTTWGATRASVTTNTIVAPNGTLTGDKLVEDTTATSTHFVQQTLTPTAGTTYTFSCYLKAAERKAAGLIFTGGGASDTGVWINLETGAFIRQTGTPISFLITSVGNGFFRISVTSAATTTATLAARINIAEDAVTAPSSYTGDGTSGIYVWGAQLEAGAFPTSYIPTTTTALTRNADVASMTGTNFSSWYNASEGTLYAEGFVYTAPANTVIPCLFSIDDNTGSNRIQLYRANNNGSPNAGLAVVNGGSIQALITAGNTQFQNGKIAGAYKVDNFAASLNGAAAVTDTIGTIPTVTQMKIGTGPALANVNGTIRRIAYYPTRLANAQLQALTV
jgi:hypothetical protein